ncbi:MAG: sigma-54 factor interaction domain-containing protein, partial [Acidobacteriota bacterium]|nr:sigma-54 factor interaction domain-containing protein [Acidobacteriota bacterium]
MNATQEPDHVAGIHHHRSVGAHAPLANFNSVEFEQAETAEAALHRLADFAARRGHRLRQIRYQTPAHLISIELGGMGEMNPHGCEILIPTASADAHLLITLERQPNVDERRRMEIAGHQAVLRVEQCIRRRPHQGHPQCASTDTDELATQSVYQSELVGSSAPMKALAGVIRKIALLTSTVLILGETGTGKELVARDLHRNSPRANQPFVAINCNALTETIFDSQLLGHIRGAFTGAHRDEPGAVRAAAGGTLFLDEIGDVPLPLQGKLLRVLQERTVTPVGSHKEYKVDVRFVAATNKDLEREVREERFR